MIRPRMVSSVATEIIRWNDVIGRAGQAPKAGGANFRVTGAVTTRLGRRVGADAVSGSTERHRVVAAASVDSASRRLSRDQTAPTVLRALPAARTRTASANASPRSA